MLISLPSKTMFLQIDFKAVGLEQMRVILYNISFAGKLSEMRLGSHV